MNKVASDKQIKKVLDAIPDGVVIADLGGVITVANKAALKILGLKETQVVGRTYDDPAWRVTSANGKPLPPYKLPIAQIIKTGKSVRNAEIAIEQTDGRRVVLSVSGAPLVDEEGRQIGAIASFIDTTEFKEALDALRESEEKYRALVNNASDAIFMADEEGNFVDVNKGAEELTGYSRDELLTMSFRHLHPEDMAESVSKSFEEGLKTGSGRLTDVDLVRKDGKRICIDLSGTVVEYSNKRMAIAIIRDITERKRTEELSSALNEINVAINSTLEFDEIMKRVIERSARAMNAETAAIDLRKGNYWVVSYLYGLPSTLIGTRFTDSESRHSVMAAETKRPFVSTDAANDKRLNLEIVKRFSLRSILVIPLIVKEEVIGVLFFSYHKEPVAFSDSEIDFATKLAASVSLALENAQVYSTEHQIAETLQEALLITPECISGIEFGHLYRSATESAKVGGDFYDIFELDDRMIGVMVGDVSGKGIGAATLTAMVKNAIKAHAYERCLPSSVMAKVNDMVLRSSPDDSFVTVFFALLDRKTGELIYCSAGHPPALLKRASGEVEMLSSSSPIIGAFENMQYRDGKQFLEKGDILVAYTDGLTEARCKFGLFGEERLAILLNGLRNESAASMPAAIINKIMECAEGVLVDDVALMAVGLARK